MDRQEQKTVKSGVALLRILESWGVDHIYGIPGGSFNSMMNALYDEQNSVKFIQVRHEETGAIAAAVDAKVTGRIGVCFGSAGPGATHLFNGLYDAQMDKVPVLALVGQVSSKIMNRNYFQEMNENPMFTDVSVYNRVVMTPESIPYMVDDAIRTAVERKGVAVLTIPVDFGYVDIPDVYVSSAPCHRGSLPLADDKDIREAAELIAQAERPVLFVGQGIRNSISDALAFSAHFSLPVVTTVLAKGLIPDNFENLLGTSWRLGTKPGNEALAVTDLVIFVGSDYPFAQVMFPAAAKFIQIDIDSSRLGRRHTTDVAVHGDAGDAMRRIVEAGPAIEPGGWLKGNRNNRKNWLEYLDRMTGRDSDRVEAESIFKEINRIAEPDAIFVTDVGNVTVHAVRMLEMNGTGQMFTTSGLFATMGYGIPGGIAARLSHPSRQVFTLNGDGGFSMAMQDITTQVKYGLPIINVVLSNDSFGFIEAEQEDTRQPKYGVDLFETDYAALGRAMGAKGYTVTERSQLKSVFDEAAATDGPVVIDVKITNRRPFPAEDMRYDTDRFTQSEIADFISEYDAGGMPLLNELIKA